MKTLSRDACFEWRESRGIPRSSAHLSEFSKPYEDQFPLPKGALHISALFGSVLDTLEPFEGALLELTDWAHYSPDQMAVVGQVRRACGEALPLIDTPGHVFGPEERDLLHGLLALVTSYGWTAYLYNIYPRITFLSWDGERLGVWSPDHDCFSAACSILREDIHRSSGGGIGRED